MKWPHIVDITHTLLWTDQKIIKTMEPYEVLVNQPVVIDNVSTILFS